MFSLNNNARDNIMQLQQSKPRDIGGMVILIGIVIGLQIGHVDFMLLNIPGLTFKNLSYIVALLTLLNYTNNGTRKIPAIFMCLFLLTGAFGVVKMLNTVTEGVIIYSGIQLIINSFLSLWLIYLLLRQNLTQIQFAILIKTIVTVFALCIVVWSLKMPHFGFDIEKQRLYPCTIDPNEFCMYAAFTIFGGVWALQQLKSYGRSFLLPISIFIIAAAAVLTVSRSGYLGLLSALFIARFSMFLNAKSQMRSFLLMVLAISVVITVSVFITEQLDYSDVFQRLEFDGNESSDDIQRYSSGRLDIWQVYLQSIEGSPWFGYLSPDFITCVAIPFEYETNALYMPHNILLTYFVFYGIPVTIFAFFIIFTLGVQLFKEEYKFNKRGSNFLFAGGYTACIITSMALSHDIVFLLALFALAHGKLRQFNENRESPDFTEEV